MILYTGSNWQQVAHYCGIPASMVELLAGGVMKMGELRLEPGDWIDYADYAEEYADEND